jgi:N-acetylglucosaminyl-diphospho-decaprenol L-rhamnosyltransferase
MSDYDLSIIIVNWNARDYLKPCLESIYAETNRLRLEICLVDNASHDGSAEMVEAGFPEVYVIRNLQNVGYAAANNQGLRWAKGKYILLLNPDTVITDRALERLADFLEGRPRAAVVGPQLVSPEGRVQGGAAGYDPSLSTVFNYHFFLNRLAPRRFRGLWLARGRYADPSPIQVDWVTGACLMARGEAVRQVGGLDEGYFMYAEDMAWCAKMRAAGWEVYCLPTVRVIHHIGVSARQQGSRFMARNIESLDRYYRSRYGAATVAALHLIGAAGFGLRYILAMLRQLRQGPLPTPESPALWRACLGASIRCLWRPARAPRNDALAERQAWRA